MINIVQFLSGNPVLNVISWLITLITAAGLFITVFLIVSGLFKPMVRLGLSRSMQNICIVGTPEHTRVVKEDLADSCVVPKRRLKELTEKSLESVDDSAILIACADGLNDGEVLEAVQSKGKMAGAIMYTTNRLDDSFRNKLNKHQHVSMVNMRGRLINEIMALYMTTKTPPKKKTL